MKKRLLSSLLALAMLLTLLPAQALATEEETQETGPVESPTEWYYYGKDETSAIPMSFLGLDNGTVMKDGSTAVNRIDRMDIGADDTDPIRKFYDQLVEGADNDGVGDFLIQDSYYTPTDTENLYVNILSEEVN